MTTYKGIKGLTVRKVAGDPSPLAAGDIWYSSTTKKIRGAKLVSAWASAPDQSNPTYQGSGAGTATAALSTGGKASPTSYNANTEEYNGSAWSEGGDQPVAISYFTGAGTQTAALIAGGAPTVRDETYEYDGSSWTAGGALNQQRKQGGGWGTQTAALVSGGETPPITNLTEIYDGSSWTEVGDMNQPRNNCIGFGTSTDGAMVGGSASVPATYTAEEWNGTSWTATNALNTGREQGGNTGTGVASTLGLFIGGSSPGIPSPGIYAGMEEYNGSTWSEKEDMSNRRAQSHNTRTAVGSAISAAAGVAGCLSNTVEEYSSGPVASSLSSS